MDNRRILKQWVLKKMDDGNDGTYYVVGHAYGHKGYPDGTKVETGKILARTEDGKSIVCEGGKGWYLEDINKEATPAERQFSEENLRKTHLEKFTIDDSGVATVVAPSPEKAVEPAKK